MSNPDPNAAAPAKKSRKGLMIVLVLVVLLLAGGGGGAYWFLLRTPANAEAAEAEPPPPPAPTGIVPLEPFVVNLADQSASRFLRVTLSLVVDEEHAKELEEDKVAHMRVRSAILELLAQKNAGELVTPDGKARLKQAIAEGVAHAAHELKVSDVLFSEFIVQF
jgi:flagellar FliL protein